VQAGDYATGLSLQQSDLTDRQLELFARGYLCSSPVSDFGQCRNPVILLNMRGVEAAAGTPGLTVVTVEIQRMEDNALKRRATKGDLVTG